MERAKIVTAEGVELMLAFTWEEAFAEATIAANRSGMPVSVVAYGEYEMNLPRLGFSAKVPDGTVLATRQPFRTIGEAMSKAEWEASLDAVEDGLATDLMRCYHCYQETTGRVEGTERRTALSPLRGIVNEGIGRGPDSTAFYTLTCGHVAI